MRDIFITSDTHFNHKNILNFIGLNGEPVRPGFSSVDEMNEIMIENWNKTVGVNDIVYHCGDVYFGPVAAADLILSRLNGDKRIILGNHDDGELPIFNKHFKKIRGDRYFKDFSLSLSHIPTHPDSIKGDRNVHGHIHEKLIDDDRYVNVCVEHTNYTPVAIEEI